MKKYYILVVILFFIVVGEVIFLFTNNNKKIERENSYTNNIKEIEVREISKYLSYVPYYLPLDFSAYDEDVSIDDIGQNVLIAMALTRGMDNYYAGKCDKVGCGYYLDNPIEIQYLYENSEEPVYGLYYFTLDYINNLLDEMYHIQLSNLEESTSWENTYAGAYGTFALQNDYFLMSSSGIGESMYHVGFVSDWIEEDNELIIYEVGAYQDTYTHTLNDYHNGYEIVIDAYDDTLDKEILKENQSSFTHYKHVFKKGDKGYFWYSTEAI